jgi:predicted signal transduction protein with EAL and GGDEF domain
LRPLRHVDGLGAINDSHGYEVGDAVLEHTARRLQHGSDGLMAMSRVSGDEYALCLDRPPAETKRVADHPSRNSSEGWTRVASSCGSGCRSVSPARCRVKLESGWSAVRPSRCARQMPAVELKLDRSFVMDMLDSADARLVVKSVVDMAHALNLRVVAEGVETAVHRDLMLDVGCDELQGYFFAKPMIAGAIAVWAFDQRFAPMREFRPSLFDDADQAAASRPR